MAKIRMLKDASGSENGFEVKAFLSEQEYEVGDALAAAFVDDQRVAERVGVSAAAHAVKGAVEKVADAVTGKGKKKPAEGDAPTE